MQRKQQQAEQRKAGCSMLVGVLPWMTMDQANVVMEMKQDIIEQATNYCMNTDPADLFMGINEWKKSHPAPPAPSTAATTNISNNNSNDNATTAVSAMTMDLDPGFAMLSNNNRSGFDKRVLNRQQSTGDLKQVTFRCNDI
eukprot:105941_1